MKSLKAKFKKTEVRICFEACEALHVGVFKSGTPVCYPFKCFYVEPNVIVFSCSKLTKLFRYCEFQVS